MDDMHHASAELSTAVTADPTLVNRADIQSSSSNSPGPNVLISGTMERYFAEWPHFRSDNVR